MDGKTTIKYLQNYLKEKDYHPERASDYFLKLVEEVGELSKALHNKSCMENTNSIKGTIDEEIWDVIYYTLAIANLYDIDVENAIKQKEMINQVKYPSHVIFEENR